MNVHDAARAMEFAEAELLSEYRDWLDRDLVIRRYRIPTGETLVCDSFDAGANELIEAKCSATRPQVRMALAQLLDYRRHHTPPPGLAVLVPELPNDDLLALVHEFGVSVIWRDNGIFSRVEPEGAQACD